MTADRTRSGTTSKSAAKTSPTKTSPTKTSVAKKSTANKTAAKKTTANKSTARKATARKSTNNQPTSGSSGSAPRAESRPRPRAGQVAAEAARQLLELTGRQAEGITGLERTDDGWTVQVEVVEVRRIPDTTDVLALYEVTTDDGGGLEGYRRLRRYVRGTPGQDSG